MIVNAARRPRRRSVNSAPEPIAVAPVDSYAIGEINQTVFDCPKCSRPLALGTRRCPGCRTRLVLGVPMSKATIFTTAGLAVGIAVGSAGGIVFAATHIVPAAVPVAAAPSIAPLAGSTAGTAAVPTTPPIPSAVPASAGTGTETAMPPLARSALVQAIAVNEQLAAASDALRTALATSPFDASQVAEVLRGISADTVYAADLANRVSVWPDAAAIGTDLSGAYGTIHDAATEALVASVRNATAYRDGARTIVTLLARIGPVDARARDLAAGQGIGLPDATTQP